MEQNPGSAQLPQPPGGQLIGMAASFAWGELKAEKSFFRSDCWQRGHATGSSARLSNFSKRLSQELQAYS